MVGGEDKEGKEVMLKSPPTLSMDILSMILQDYEEYLAMEDALLIELGLRNPPKTEEN